MMIERQVANVFYAPVRRRRYFSLSAAISGEATAIIFKKYPTEEAEYDDCGRCECGGWHIRVDDADRYEVMHRRMCRLIKSAYMAKRSRTIPGFEETKSNLDALTIRTREQQQ